MLTDTYKHVLLYTLPMIIQVSKGFILIINRKVIGLYKTIERARKKLGTIEYSKYKKVLTLHTNKAQ